MFDAPNIIDYQWEKLASSVQFPTSTLSGNLSLNPLCNEMLKFRVRARNVCGYSAWQEIEYFMNRCTNDCTLNQPPPLVGDNFILNPNPVTDGALNISVKNDSPWFSVPVNGNLTDANGMQYTTIMANIRVNISILNQAGTLVQNLTNHPIPTQLNLSNLPHGTYVVIFEYLGQFESYTIIKN